LVLAIVKDAAVMMGIGIMPAARRASRLDPVEARRSE
jgi:hypothetical protein